MFPRCVWKEENIGAFFWEKALHIIGAATEKALLLVDVCLVRAFYNTEATTDHGSLGKSCWHILKSAWEKMLPKVLWGQLVFESHINLERTRIRNSGKHLWQIHN